MSMHSTYDSTVNSFYLAFYGRPADPAGLAFWSQQLANNEGDFGAIVDVFANSEEARTRFGSDSVADRITDIYAQLFNRAPDAAGMAFWTNAIEQGHASLADVAMSILGGAQGSDATLSQMRQQAADAFTAQVEASGTEYSGYASIEAARILVRAITPAATAQDLDVLVKAAVSFADTATKTPQVVEAIAVNTTLLALFDTTRGVLEPVGLAQALADTAKAAAGDPVTLESLLRGGGMDKVLKVMPAKATLVDVVDALAKGGLPAAVEVVYPTAPTAPTTPAPNPPSIKLDFLGVTQGEGDTTPDHVTSAVKADVQFAYEGADLRAGQRFEYSTDNGKTWSTAGLGTNTATNIVTIKDVDLGKGAAADSTDSTADLATVFQLRAVDAAGKVFASASQQIVHDHHAAAPVVALAANPAAVHFGEDGLRVTNVKQLVVSGLETGAKVEYRIVSKLKDLDDATVWSDDMPALNDGRHTIAVRQTDAAGNVSQEQWISFTLDTEAPGQPRIALALDTGSSDTDGITHAGAVTIDGLEANTASGWQYSLDNGANWTFGGRNDGSGKATLDLARLPAHSGKLLVSQIDAAGNTGTPSAALAFTYDDTAPTNAIAFTRIEGGEPGDATTGNPHPGVTFALSGSDDGIVEWRLKDGGAGWTQVQELNDNGSFTVFGLDLGKGDQTVEVRVVDAAGNVGQSIAQTIHGVFAPPAPQFQITATPSGIAITGTATDAVTIDLGKDTIARAGHPEQQNIHDIQKVDASAYAGLVTVVGSAAEVRVATADIGNGVDAHGIVDTKAHLFSGEPGARVFASSDVGLLLEGATFVKLDGMLSLEEHVLLTNLLGQKIDKVELVVDASLPAKPIVALVTDSGTLPFTDHDGITKVAGFEVSNQEHGATLQYSPNGENGWTDMAPPAIEGKNELYVRQVDQAGNVSDVARFTYVLDQTPPPAVSFLHVVGAGIATPTAIDATQADVVFSVAGTLDEDDIPQYRVGGLGPWTNLPSDAWDGLHNTLTVKGVWLLNEDPKVEVRIVDLAGNEGTAASMTVNGPFGNIVPVITVTQTPGGLLVESNVAGEIRIGGELVVSDHASGGATVGSVLVGAQQQAFSGKLTVTPAGGQPAPDASGRSYVLGDGESTTLEGRNVWAFDGHDTLKGTPLNDYLSGGAGQDNIKPAGGGDTVVGGAGADRISLERDAYPDTLVYEAGDTLTGVFIDGSELDGMDRINGAEAGDVIQVGAIFSANPTIVDTYLTDPTANQVAIVRGTEVFAFHADKNGNTYVLQWTDGTNINSISLFNTGTNGLALDIDVVNGRMTLAQPVIPVAPEFTLTVQPSGVSIAGTSGDVVMIDLTRDTVERAGHPEVQVPHDILDIAAADYVGIVEVIGNVAEVLALRAGASVNGIDGFNIVDAKSHLFTGEPGARGLAPGVQEALLNGVELVKVGGEVSAEEYALLAGVLGSHIDKVDLSLDDERPALPQVALDIDSGRVPHEYVDNYTNVGTFKVTNLEPGATAQYSLNGIDGWTTTAPAAVAGDNEVYVRQVDTAGNASDVELFGFFLDDVKPLAPTLKLAGDTGRSYNDKVTMLDEVKISGLEQSGTIYQYRTSPGGQWQDGGQADYLGNATLQVPGEGNVFIEVRQVDVAGNEGDPVSLSFVLDKTPPPDVAFAYVTGANMTTPDVTDAVLADVVFSVSGVLDAFDIPQYRIGGSGPWIDLPSAAWNDLDRTLTVAGVSLQDEDPLVEVRIVDIAGHEGVPAGRHINGPFGNVEVPPELEPLPMPNYLGAVQPNLHLVPGSLTVSADIGMVTGLANLSGLKVEDFSDGVGKNPEMSFLRPADVAMNGNVLTFSGPVSMDLYRMSWTDGTFSTTDGPMAAATVYFAGGRTSIFQHKGFQVDAITPLAGTIERPYFDAYSEAFIDDGLSTSRVMTGGDHDVIADNGGILTIAYDNIGNGADDIILGFDADDTISLEGSLAQRIDDNADGIIQWHNVPTSSKKTVMPADEAVTITVGNLVTVGVGPMEMAQTLQTLNSRLDVTSFGYGEELLILAKAGFGAMGTLFLFVNQNGGTIDANELTVIASFNEGLPGQDDIVVVGSQTGIPGDFIGGEF